MTFCNKGPDTPCGHQRSREANHHTDGSEPGRDSEGELRVQRLYGDREPRPEEYKAGGIENGSQGVPTGPTGVA